MRKRHLLIQLLEEEARGMPRRQMTNGKLCGANRKSCRNSEPSDKGGEFGNKQ